MRYIPAIFLASLTIISQSQMAFSQQPISQGEWTYKNEKPESVTFDYGTALTVKEIDRLSRCTSLTRIVMGYAGVDSEYVEIEGDLLKLGRLKNLKDVHLNKDGVNDDDLKFVALLPKIHTLEFNADNGYDGAPVCTDQCGDHLSSAKTLRRLLIHDGEFTDNFVAKIVRGLPDLEELSLNSAKLTNESLRLLAERCKKLKSLSIASDHFTAEGLKHLDKLKDLKKRAVSSPALRKRNNPKEISKLLGTWEYVSATYEGKPVGIGKNETITLTKDSWTLRRNGKLISSSTWEIDSTRSPKWLTQFTRGGKVNFLDRWVYKFDEEQLVLCKSSWMDERRPKEFISRKGDKQYLIVVRRMDTKGNLTHGQDAVEKEEAKSEVAIKKDVVWTETLLKRFREVELQHKTFSPNKKVYAGFYQDGWTETISIHDGKSGKQIRRIVGHGDFVTRFKFSTDGKLLASYDNRKGWKLWDISTGKMLLHLPAANSDEVGRGRLPDRQQPKDVPPVIGTAVVLPADPGSKNWSLKLAIPKVTWKVVGQRKPKTEWPEFKVDVEEAVVTLPMHYPQATAVAADAQNRVLDLKGKRLSVEAVFKRLDRKTPVLVSVSGRMPDPFYLQFTRRDTLIVVLGIPKAPVPTLLPQPSVERADQKEGSAKNGAAPAQ